MVLNLRSWRYCRIDEKASFRPLTGFMVLNLDKKANNKRTMLSFRPLTGFMVLNRFYGKARTIIDGFPSPYGVYGS